ncbi:putative Leucine-rich receptor-like kinase family protein [Melia azedarach]|uniref:Leucine-rich receptor-like kinase family protein n=1 Tax=Melia azedarach TaxID=155640 RepID=A0ACC1X6A2_MELAZ|nr:putative Leucine-rich receptor-like kinase family protein [Melia azedarach]
MGNLSLCFFAFMHLVSSSLLFHTAAFTHFASSLHPVCHDQERSALLKFKDSLIIDQFASIDPSAYPKVSSWEPDKENGNCCLWDGIECDEETGHVVKLDLSSSFLYCSINSTSSLFQLVHLQWLNLADNNFDLSTIPSGIINLTRLSHLNLSFSSFWGQIPREILELSKLVSLDLSYNYDLELQNPSLKHLVGNLFNLNVLDLSRVKISSPIPPALTNLSSLTFLSFRRCGLQGKILSSLADLTKLEHLDLSYNGFSGELPASFGNLTQLSYLSISGNNNSHVQTSDSLSWIANLQNLTYLKLSNRSLTGELPFALMNLTQLTALDLSYNQLIGPIPAWLMNLNKLRSLVLDSNKLSGQIPFEIKNLTQLQNLRLSSIGLEGSIPSSIFELKDLQQLSLSFNNLSGTVDLSMFILHLKSLETLDLSSNKLSLLTGTAVNTTLPKFIVIGFSSCNLSNFPYFLHNQDQLASLDLSSNKIAGQVPAWFLNVATNSLEYLNLSSNQLTSFGHKLNVLPWTGLDTLDLSFNKLQGQLPVPSGCEFSYIVSNNELTGHVPPRICNLNKLRALDLSYNNLSGMLPKCLGNFSQELSILKLKGNNFHGSIPQTFMNSSKLMMIDLSNNSFQGRIPQSLANCVKLKFLNLGNNQIADFFPSWLGTLPVLEVLVLKFNKLYGIIENPKTGLEFPKLRIIDVSHNRFTGNLPSKYFLCWNDERHQCK